MVPMDSLKKNPNLEATNHHHVPPLPSSSSHDFKITHNHPQENGDHTHGLKKTRDANYEMIKHPTFISCSSLAAGSGQGDRRQPPPQPQDTVVVEESGRDRLESHRVKMAGRVWIPDLWGQEDFLKEWIDCTVFDSSLGNNSIMSARAALVQEGRSRSSLRIENRC